MDGAEILLVLAAVVIGAFVKGVTGVGLPVLAIPILASFTSVEYAVAVIAIPAVLSNSWLMWRYRKRFAGMGPLLAPLLVAGGIGAVLGAWLLVSIDDTIMSLALAAFIVAYIGWYLWDRELRLPEDLARRISAPVGLVAGALQGATGISGPVLAAYFHSMRLTREVFIVAITTPFWLLGVVQVVAMAVFGVYSPDRIVAAAAACVPVVVILPLAMRVGDRMGGRTFQLAVLGILAVSAVRLVWSAL